MNERNTSGSGEHYAVMLDAIREMRDDQRDFRRNVSEKLDNQKEEIGQILVNLAEGTGRMNVMQTTIDTVKTTSEKHGRMLESIERGSGMRPAVRSAKMEEKPEGGWISVDKLPSIIVAIGSLVAIVISSIALIKTPSASVTDNSVSPTPVHTR